MEYTPNPNLSDSERLIMIEVMLVNTLREQEAQSKSICQIRRVLWIACGVVATSMGTSGMAWLSALGKA
jgi:hypothetical protein